MPGTMTQPDLVADLKASLQLAADAFRDADDGAFKRHLQAAALDFSCLRPRTLVGSITAVADQSDYAAPTDFYEFKSSLWGVNRQAIKPWDTNWPGRLPLVRAVELAGVRKLSLDPAPTVLQIGVLGAEHKFYYYAVHQIDVAVSASTTIAPGDRGLLLLRAQAEAMRELSMRNVNKPLAMRDGLNSQPRNGTPAYLFEALMREFRERIAA